ncbi:hypothetical protein M569_17314 [Genlisea aurea]|uniref:S-protein homolog n=1 Tax=Genlisea aurea TaxID=192259 RepID=S8BSY2_9LAMI|nr:hypothetical protein M569_17314 [Genlisea aurea]
MQHQRLILFCFAAAVAATFQAAIGCVGTKRQTVHVANNFSADDNASLLLAHCASKDDDFGVKSLGPPNQEFNWSFCPRIIFRDTLYFCHLFWGAKQRAFVAYDEKWRLRGDETEHHWLAEDGGIYYYNDGDTPIKVKTFDWQ